jgi:hypothetical protein
MTPIIYLDKMTPIIYLIGSLRNPEIPYIGNRLRALGFEVFDDWFAGGKIADDEWQAYETVRENSYQTALNGYAAKHVFDFDYYHLNRATIGLLILPGGKSSHLELGYMLGQGKPGYVLFDQVPDRYDVMYKFATGVFFNPEEMYGTLTAKHLQTKTT